MQHWMKRLLLALGAALALACGGVDGAPDTDTMGELQQRLDKEVNFGVRADNRKPCTTPYSGTCYYPDEYQLFYCYAGPGWTQLEIASIEIYLHGLPDANTDRDGVIGELMHNPNGIYDPAFVYSYTGDCRDADVALYRGATGGAYGTPAGQGIAAYQSMFCSAPGTVYAEIPVAISGTHRPCHLWSATLDVDDILQWPANQRGEVFVHALGAIFATASGAGLHDFDDPMVWTYTTVTPLGKRGLRETDYCRAVFSEVSSQGVISIEQNGSFCF